MTQGSTIDMWGQRLTRLRRDRSGFWNPPSDLDHAGFYPPNPAPTHSRFERRAGQSHSLIRVATPCGPVVVAPRLKRAPR